MSANVQPSPVIRSILICVSALANSSRFLIEGIASTPEHQQVHARGLRPC